MAQWIKYLLYKYKEPISDLQYLHKKLGMVKAVIIPTLRGLWYHENSQSTTLVSQKKYRFNERT